MTIDLRLGDCLEMWRVWAMPARDTFDVKPIGEFVKEYLGKSKVSIDPFARNKRWATYTNDINPNTSAEYHLDSVAFLELLVNRGIVADLVIFDPPYSPTQMKRAYDGCGLAMNGRDALRTAGWKTERDLIQLLVPIGGIVLTFGWSSSGMSRKRGFIQEKIMLVCHGAGHNDTICIAERRIAEAQAQMTMALT